MISAPIARLIKELKKLPGVGEKTAMRLALHLLAGSTDDARALASSLLDAKERTRPCSSCFQLTDEDFCEICSSHRRDRSVVCVVEDQAGLMAIEAARHFNGLYHVLGGRLSPMDGVGPDQLRLDELSQRVVGGGVTELILATNPSVEGEATSLLIKRKFEGTNIKISRIARGIPVGGDLEYSDSLTLGRALDDRTPY